MECCLDLSQAINLFSRHRAHNSWARRDNKDPNKEKERISISFMKHLCVERMTTTKGREGNKWNMNHDKSGVWCCVLSGAFDEMGRKEGRETSDKSGGCGCCDRLNEWSNSRMKRKRCCCCTHERGPEKNGRRSRRWPKIDTSASHPEMKKFFLSCSMSEHSISSFGGEVEIYDTQSSGILSHSPSNRETQKTGYSESVQASFLMELQYAHTLQGRAGFCSAGVWWWGRKEKKQIIDWITSSKASNLCVQEWFLVWLQCNEQQQQKKPDSSAMA